MLNSLQGPKQVKEIKIMPRMQPPKGYYTLTEATRILNISEAMVREHVKKGKIKYLVPEGRKQGFYRKKDVDKLAHELNAFLHFEDEEEFIPSTFTTASENDVHAVVDIIKATFATEENESSVTPSEKYINWLKKNAEIMYVLKRKDEVIGFATTLPLKPDSPKIQEILRADLLGEVDIATEDIEKYEPGKHIQLYIVGIGIKPDLDRELKRTYGSHLISGLISSIVELGKKGIILKEILAIGATRNGVKLLQAFGFSEIPSPKAGKRVFVLKIKESGAPISLQYQEALKEFNDQLHKAEAQS